MTGASNRLHGIEMLRGLAACAVVLSHAARHVDKAWHAPGLIRLFQPGHAGVDLFFVISGFIILFVHHGDVGVPGRLPNYLGRRFTRVMPLYWVALGLTLVLALAGRHKAPDPVDVLWSGLLLPSMAEPLLGVAWTLQNEAVFYAVFAVLIASRAAGLVLMGAWFCFIVLTSLGMGWPGVAPALGGVFSLQFFMGMGAALLVRRDRVPAPLTLAGTGAALFLLAMAGDSAGVLDGFGGLARLAYGLPATMVVAGLAAAEWAGRLAVPGWALRLGGASYSIYLFQFVFIGAAWQAWLRLGLGPWREACFVLLAVAALAGGVAASRLVERPLLDLLRRRRVVAA